MTAFINSQPARITNGIARLGGDNEWYCIPCYPDLPDDCSEWPTYGMLKMDLASITISGLNPGDYILPIQDARTLLGMKNRHTVTQVVFSASINALYGTVVFEIGRCGVYDGVYGVEDLPWYPSHAPNYYSESICLGLGCICHSGKPIWHVGVSHDLFKLRNLFHPDEPEEDRKYQHCLGIVYSSDTINLLDLIESFGLDLSNRVKWVVNGLSQTDHTLKIKKEPEDRDPAIFWVKMQEKNTDVVWDRFVLVVNSQESKTLFDAWDKKYASKTNWLAALPAAYVALSNRVGSATFYNPEPASTNLWKRFDEPGKYMHHLATYQMRSERVLNMHGHQACYDADGKIILEGVSAGTADYGSTDIGFWVLIHLEEDVKPFIRALQLDGNPCRQNGKALDHALIREGDHIKTYLERRPAIPNGKKLLQPGELPSE